MINQRQQTAPPSLSAVFTDLDGTLLNSNREVSRGNIDCLQRLGEQGTTRVIATGRSLYSFFRVIEDNFPADYLIFSSGAGILDLATGELLRSSSHSNSDTARITCLLDENSIDYMVHFTVPDNHRFIYKQHNENNPDFLRRIELYADHAESYSHCGSFPENASQIIGILPPDSNQIFSIKKTLQNYHIIRATSPLDHRSIWMEIYPQNIHKGNGAAWLCEHLNIDPSRSVGIGNDYNDIDLLDFTPLSYLLQNAPKELHNHYCLTSSNDDDGFCNAVLDAEKKINDHP